MSILEQLYDGKVYPCEEILPQNHAEYRAISGQVGNDYEHLLKELPPEQLKRFEELDKGRTKLSNMQAYANFEYGFKLGARLMSEVFSNPQDVKE